MARPSPSASAVAAGAPRESQPLLPLGVARPTRSPVTSASPARGHLLSFEAGFPSLVDENELLASELKQPQPPLAQDRWTTLSVLLTLLMSAIGSGTLAVPYTLLLLSPTQAVVAIVLVGAAMAFTADVILRVHVAVVASAQHEEVRETYQELALHAGGEKLSRFVSFAAGFAVFGACVGCVRVVKDMAPTLLGLVYLHDEEAFEGLPSSEQQALVTRTVWIIFMAVVLPLGFFKKISVLRYSSYLGFTFCLYLVIAVAYRSVVGVAPESLVAPVGLEPLEIHESLFSKLSVAIGIYNFTYMLHLNVIPLFPQVLASERQHRRDQRDVVEAARGRMSRLVYAAVAICALLYAVFGLCAASIYGSLTQGNILLNLAHDPIMAVPRVMILLTILFSFPLLFHPLRCLVLEMQWCCGAQPSRLTQFVVSVLLMVLQLLVATRVPGIQVVFSFVGSSILLVLCYAMPTLFHLRLVRWRATRSGRRRMYALAVLLAVAAVFCSIATVKLLH